MDSRDNAGRLVVGLRSSTDTTLLRRASDILTSELGFEPKDRFDSPELKWWDFARGPMRVSLAWHHEDGLGLQANDTLPASERFTRQIVDELDRRLT